MKDMIGYCGLDCEKCDAYLATVHDELQNLQFRRSIHATILKVQWISSLSIIMKKRLPMEWTCPMIQPKFIQEAEDRGYL